MLANPMVIKAIAILGPDTSPIATSYISFEPATAMIPRTGLKLWLKSDFGPVATSGSISRWVDLSNSNNDATQSNSANQPSLQTAVINGLASTIYNGTSQFFDLTSGFADLTSGCSLFFVVKPKSTGSGTILVSGNSGPTDMINVQNNGTQGVFECYNSTTPSTLSTSSGALALNRYQLIEATQTGPGSGTIYVNGSLAAQGPLQNLLNVTRTQNRVAADLSASSFWQGEIAELLVFNRNLTQAERASTSAYLIWKFQVTSAAATAPPIISVPGGTLVEPTQVAIATQGNAVTYVTTDGTPPNPTTSPVYQKPLNVSYSQTVQAISVVDGVQSTISSASYVLDPSKFPAPNPSDPTTLQLDLDLPTLTQ